ncbi:uncharacterized protein LOC144160150 [Haemaphysalis longicornis]
MTRQRREPCALARARGRVAWVSRFCGCIGVRRPVRALVYFEAQDFEPSRRHGDLIAAGLRRDEQVFCSAVPHNYADSGVKYRAYDVKRVHRGNAATIMPASGGGNDGKPPPLLALSEFPPLSETGRLPTSLFDEEGVIEYLRDAIGFIRFKRFPSESASFHKDDEARYLGRPVRFVTDSFKLGDLVRFDAEQNGRKEVKARWRVLAFHHVKGVPGWASPKPCKEWGCAEDLPRVLAGHDGVIDRLRSDYGFIRLGPHPTPAAYFRLAVVERSMQRTVEDLTDIFTIGDMVRFDAELNLKESTSARWWVTYIRPSSGGLPAVSDASHGDESSGRAAAMMARSIAAKDDDDAKEAPLLSEGLKRDHKSPPWSYARCAARAVAQDSEEATSKQPDKAAAPVPRMTSLVVRPSVLIYRGARAVVRGVVEGAKVECEVRETGGVRRVMMTGVPLYRDGVRTPADEVVKAVGEGDALSLDYAAGADGTSKDAEVYCHVAWLGERPEEVPPMSVEQLARTLRVPNGQDVAGSGEAKRKPKKKAAPAHSESVDCPAENDTDGAGAADELRSAGNDAMMKFIPWSQLRKGHG